MDVREVAAIAKQQINDLFAGDMPQNVRLETFLYDDHLMVWSLTTGLPAGSSERNEPDADVLDLAL